MKVVAEHRTNGGISPKEFEKKINEVKKELVNELANKIFDVSEVVWNTEGGNTKHTLTTHVYSRVEVERLYSHIKSIYSPFYSDAEPDYKLKELLLKEFGEFIEPTDSATEELLRTALTESNKAYSEQKLLCEEYRDKLEHLGYRPVQTSDETPNLKKELDHWKKKAEYWKTKANVVTHDLEYLVNESEKNTSWWKFW